MAEVVDTEPPRGDFQGVIAGIDSWSLAQCLKQLGALPFDELTGELEGSKENQGRSIKDWMQRHRFARKLNGRLQQSEGEFELDGGKRIRISNKGARWCLYKLRGKEWSKSLEKDRLPEKKDSMTVFSFEGLDIISGADSLGALALIFIILLIIAFTPLIWMTFTLLLLAGLTILSAGKLPNRLTLWQLNMSGFEKVELAELARAVIVEDGILSRGWEAHLAHHSRRKTGELRRYHQLFNGYLKWLLVSSLVTGLFLPIALVVDNETLNGILIWWVLGWAVSFLMCWYRLVLEPHKEFGPEFG